MPPDAQFPIELTSPLTRGPLVRDIQRLLKKNRHGHFNPGRVDGVYGPRTAQAAREAKQAIGYDEANITSAYGRYLHGFLTGTAEPSKEMRKQAERRRLLDSRKPMRVTALEGMTKKLGTTEQPPGSNNILYSRWYMRDLDGWNSGGPPYCMMGVTYEYVQAGSVAFKQTQRWAFCPFFLRDAQQGLYGLRIVDDPLPGDAVLFEWGDSGPGEPDHVGLFEKRVDSNTVQTVEANVDSGVFRKTREEAIITAYVRVTK